MKLHTSLLGLAVAVASAATIQDAQAVIRLNAVNATGACQAALPAYDAALRKRPAGISNEGTRVAFVSCSLTEDVISSETFAFGMLLANNTGTETVVNCTFVDGVRFGDELPRQFPFQVAVPANGSEEFSTDSPAWFQQGISSVSCALPAGVELNTVYTVSDDEGGMPPVR